MDDASHFDHRRAWDLIPWVVNETASADDRRLVDDHLATCADCRDELAFHRALQAGMTTPPLPTDAGPALSRLWARIDLAEWDDASGWSGVAPRHVRRSRWIGGLAAVVAVQAIALATLGGLFLGRHAPVVVPYDTLSSAPAASEEPTIRLVVAPEMRIGDLQASLARAGVHIVRSSGDSTILGLASSAGTVPHADALALLRRTPQVLLAEPVGPAAASAR